MGHVKGVTKFEYNNFLKVLNKTEGWRQKLKKSYCPWYSNYVTKQFLNDTQRMPYKV